MIARLPADVFNDAPADVIVVGAGVIGLAVARELRLRGAGVRVLERRQAGAGASAVAAGMLAPVSEVEYGEAGRRLLRLGLAAAAMWPRYAAELERESGYEVGLMSTGSLLLARDRDEAEVLERELEHRRELGLPVRRLRPSQARALEPALAPTIRLALEAPDDHSVDPRRVLAALSADVPELLCGAAVDGLVVDGARVAGVRLIDGSELAADAVIVCAGAWSAALAGPRAELPVRPVKGQIMRLRDRGGAGLITRVLRFPGGYLVPRTDGRYVLGATVEERGFDTEPTVGGALELLREAQQLVPGLSELEIAELGAGLRPGTPDNLPLIGRGELDGLLWATGHYRNGILLAPLTAMLIADAVTGAPPSELAELCDPRRFVAADRAEALP